MRLTSRAPFALILLFLVLSGPAPDAFAADREDSIRFSWALIYENHQGNFEPIDYRADTVRLQSGDRFKIFLQPQSECYIYLLLHDSQKNLFLLFPEDFELFEGNTRLVRTYELPGANSWFYLDDNSGTELFYLVVSNRRLDQLERKVGGFLTGSSTSRRDRQAGSGKYAVLDEVKRLIKENSYLSDAAEKPVAVAGNFRGIREEDELNGIRIEAAGIYVETIRIQH